jgi:uncharacterized protein (TIGR03435 family)
MDRSLQFSVSKPGVSESEVRVSCSNITFPLFAQLLHRYYGIPVVDNTGLSQRFNLNFVVIEGPPEWDPVTGGKPAINLADVRKLLSAYGISLEIRQGTVDFLVVDRVADEAKFLN